MPFHSTVLYQRCTLLLSSCLLLSVLLAVGQAQVPTTITPDGTLGTTVTQTGTVYTINGRDIKGGRISFIASTASVWGQTIPHVSVVPRGLRTS